MLFLYVMKKPILLRELNERVNGRKWGEFKCSCGKTYKTNLYDVKHGKSTSCGCVRDINNHIRLYKHGKTKTELYSRWASMRRRCRSSWKDRKHYFDRGIKVCDRWNDFLMFQADMGAGFRKELSLDRIDNNKGYSPENCRWVDWTTQQNNKSDNVIFKYRNKFYTMAELSKISGISYSTMNSRLRLNRNSKIKWTVKKAVETPILTNSSRRLIY